MNKKLTFKKAGQEDVSVIAQLADRIWKKHYITIISMEQINYMLQKMYSSESLLEQMHEGHQFTIVYNSETPIGYYSWSTKDTSDYFLHKFYIESNEQGKGIGSVLFAHLLKEIPNASTIELCVNRMNFSAINFYFKKGFVIKKVVDQNIGEGYFMNDFVMCKDLR